MEKIQSALAKARAERDSKTSETGPSAAPRPTPPAVSSRHKSGAQGRGTADDARLDKVWNALPVLDLQPKLLKKNRIVALQGGQDATDIDMLRTRVLQQMRDNGWRRLAITSATAACGKSTIALNLAMSLQRQADLRTILLEVDLRRPALARMLGIESQMSFAHVLEGSRPFEENALRYGPNLVISANQRSWRDAAELLSSDQVPETLSQIEATFEPDLMIFDMPPTLVSDDMMAFARHVDCVLLVAGAESTTIKEVDICETDLATQTNVMGVVLNKCRYMGPEYGYGYYE